MSSVIEARAKSEVSKLKIRVLELESKVSDLEAAVKDNAELLDDIVAQYSKPVTQSAVSEEYTDAVEV